MWSSVEELAADVVVVMEFATISDGGYHLMAHVHGWAEARSELDKVTKDLKEILEARKNGTATMGQQFQEVVLTAAVTKLCTTLLAEYNDFCKHVADGAFFLNGSAHDGHEVTEDEIDNDAKMRGVELLTKLVKVDALPDTKAIQSAAADMAKELLGTLV